MTLDQKERVFLLTSLDGILLSTHSNLVEASKIMTMLEEEGSDLDKEIALAVIAVNRALRRLKT
jgi:hypothetical protein